MKYISPFIFIALLTAGSVLLGASAAHIQTVVSTDRAAVGDQILFQAIITLPRSAKPDELSPADFPDDLPFYVHADYPVHQQTSSFSSVNGRNRSVSSLTVIYQYRLIPRKSGTYTIPALTFKYGGSKLQTEPIRLEISERSALPPDAESLSFTQSITPKQSVPGKPVRLTWRIAIPQRLQIVRIAPNLPLAELATSFKFDPGLLHQPWERSTQNINGVPYFIYALEFEARPLAADDAITLPPATADITIAAPDSAGRNRRRSFFEDSFFDDPFGVFSNGSRKVLQVASDETQLIVKPFPDEGRPADFTGITGPLTVQVKAEPDEVAVGDPILLTITISGPNLSPESTMPDLSSQPALNESFRITGDDPGVPAEGALTFQRTLRATNDRVTEIPALRFPYYDVDRQSYGNAQSSPIPIKVKKSRQVTLADASGAGVRAGETHGQTVPAAASDADAIQDLRPNHDSANAPHGIIPGSSWSRHPGLCLAIIIPPAVWLLLVLALLTGKYRRFRRNSSRAVHARHHFLQTIASMRAGNPHSAEELYNALQEYIVTRYNFTTCNITRTDIQSLPIDDGQRQLLTHLLSQCEAARFAGSSIDPVQFSAQAANLQ